MVNASAELHELRVRRQEDSTEFHLTLRFPEGVHLERGAPVSAELLYEVPHVAAGATIQATLQWAGKTAHHGPETIWLSHRPRTSERAAWRMEKMGSLLDPAEADLTAGGCTPRGRTCGVSMHAVGDGGVTTSDPEQGTGGYLALRSRDSALVSFGEPRALPTPMLPPDMRHAAGVHHALVGNLW